jgi:hypothetical protein
MRWAAHVVCIVERRDVYKILMGKPEEKRPFGDPGLSGRIILKWIFRNWDVEARTGWI